MIVGKAFCRRFTSLVPILLIPMLLASCETPHSLGLPTPVNIPGIGGLPSLAPLAGPVPLAPPDAATVSRSVSGSSEIVYMGYTKDFLPAKQMIINGQLATLSKQVASAAGQNGQGSFWKQDDEFLRHLETGTILLDSNDTSLAIKEFSTAEVIKENRESDSVLGSFVKSSTGWMGEVFGNGAMDPYEGQGYEKVLMLNYLSIAYLLQGERKAYNVARRSIDIQNIEKKAFDARRNKAKKKLRQQQAERSDANASVNAAQSGIAAVFKAMNSKAKDVPSAYVNPFGFYVTGMIQEYESYKDTSLRDNARISYQKALELNPDSKVLRQAVKDMQKRSLPRRRRLLHVVVADGFAPEKKVLVYNFNFTGTNIPIKIPIYVPSNSRVGRIEIQTPRGKRLARLSTVADVEALCIRHQKDMETIRNLRVSLAFTSTAAENTALSYFGYLGKWVSDYHDQYKQPDTRSWMTLPEKIQAARVYLPRRLTKVRLATYSKTGKLLARKTLNLSPNKHNFIYARSINNRLYAYAAKDLWVAAAY